MKIFFLNPLYDFEICQKLPQKSERNWAFFAYFDNFCCMFYAQKRPFFICLFAQLSLLYLIFSVDCLEYSAGLFQGDFPNNKYTDLYTDECRANCDVLAECEFWTYVIEDRECYLKNGDGLRRFDTRSISGKKDCTLPPEQGGFLIILWFSKWVELWNYNF